MLAEKRKSSKIRALGAVSNCLGLLSADRQAVDPKKLEAVTGWGPTQLEKITGISRPQFYRQSTISLRPASKLMKRINRVVVATDLAFELLDHDFVETRSWLMSPNSMMFGDTPFEVCMRGDGDVLIGWLKERLTPPNNKQLA